MNFLLKSILLALLIFCSGILLGQTQAVDDTSKNVILLKERSFGIVFHTQGWGIKYSKGFNKTAFKRRMLVIEMAEMQDPKQIRIINPYFTNAKSYYYGKMNAVYIFRGSYGNYKQLNRKPYWGGVELRLLYMGGLSVGLAKPIYLYILNITAPGDFVYTTTLEKYDPEKHSVDDIFGRASFTNGFNEIGFYPGIHAKIGLNFDYASYRNKLKSLEVGATLDIFPRAIPIMAYNDPNYFFFTFYLNFNFGKRFN